MSLVHFAIAFDHLDHFQLECSSFHTVLFFGKIHIGYHTKQSLADLLLLLFFISILHRYGIMSLL
jgi:hypothetical protein